MSKAIVKTTFEASRTLRPIYTGGSTALDASGRILLTCVGEDALIVDLETGDQLASLEGVSTIFQCSHRAEPVLTISSGWRNYYELGEYVAFPCRYMTPNTHSFFSYAVCFARRCLLSLDVYAHLLSFTLRRNLQDHRGGAGPVP